MLEVSCMEMDWFPWKIDGSWWANGLVSSETPGGFFGDFPRHFYRLFLQMFPHDLQNIHIFCMKMTSDWQSRIPTTGMQGELCHLRRKKICGLVPKLRIYMHLLCWVLNTELVMYPIICWTKGIHSEVRKKSGGKHDLVDSKNGRTLFLVFYMRLCVWLALLKSKNVRWKYQKQHGDEMWNGKINGINAGYFMQWKPSVHFVQSDASCFQ